MFAPRSTIDVGTARGYVVRQLREWGVPAFGTDYSHYALATAPADTATLLAQADAAALPFRDRAADLVMCVETLEHLYPSAISDAARELARVARRWVLLSMPTFGVDEGGARGIPIEDPDHQADADANRPFRKLILDPQGRPHHGHLTLATWRWWSDQFQATGLRRIRPIEHLLNAHPFGDPNTWHFYVFAHPEAAAEFEAPAGPCVRMGEAPAWRLGEGWHGVEGASPAYRWTSGRAQVTLGFTGQRALQIRASGGPRATTASVRAGTHVLGSLSAGREWGTQHVRLPAGLPHGPLTLEINVPALFVPAEQIAGSGDRRALGVMVESIELL
ncbi:MAG: hypothetical protein RLZZ387_4646 [Chloroflexota bacterium]|jgi:hypothetical protein